jgi:hypothetical protein
VPRLDNLKGYTDAANLDCLDDRSTTASERRRRIFPDFYGKSKPKYFGGFNRVAPFMVPMKMSRKQLTMIFGLPPRSKL